MAIRTKIICTIGPAVDSYEMVVELMKAGMNVARLNFSRGTHQSYLNTINNLKRARSELQVPLAIMLDTRGPEVRVGQFRDGEALFEKGDRCQLTSQEIRGDKERFTITPPYVLGDLEEGVTVLFDDGYLSSRVVEVNDDGVVVEMDNGGVLKSKKGVNIPNVSLSLPAVTEKDIEDIRFGALHDIDIIAVSFVRSVDNIMTVKNLLRECHSEKTLVIAKIENHEGVENFDDILQGADGVMIARGDLGVEIPLSQVPKLQKQMIRKCYIAGRPSVTATQMLESMIYNPRPTRAEVSDVANAIYDSTSSVMLSGETAVGKYPIRAVEVMKSIIEETEADFDFQTIFNIHSSLKYNDVPSSVTLAAVKTAHGSNASSIFALTSSGATARLIARLRPPMPIVAMTSNHKTYHQMAFNWGVIPYECELQENFVDSFEKVSEFALEHRIVNYGDLVVVTAGSTTGISGTTNMMIVESIGDVLVRGHTGIGERVYGNIRTLLSLDTSIDPYAVRGQIIVITRCDEHYYRYIEEAAGIILESHVDDEVSESLLVQQAGLLGKPIILRADAAVQVLRDGQLVTLDPEKALIYKGVVVA